MCFEVTLTKRNILGIVQSQLMQKDWVIRSTTTWNLQPKLSPAAAIATHKVIFCEWILLGGISILQSYLSIEMFEMSYSSGIWKMIQISTTFINTIKPNSNNNKVKNSLEVRVATHSWSQQTEV